MGAFLMDLAIFVAGFYCGILFFCLFSANRNR